MCNLCLRITSKMSMVQITSICLADATASPSSLASVKSKMIYPSVTNFLKLSRAVADVVVVLFKIEA